MTGVYLYHNLIVRGGHRRQPRSSHFIISLDDPDHDPPRPPQPNAHIVNSFVTESTSMEVSYNRGRNRARLLFWSVSDGVNGRVQAPDALIEEEGRPLRTLTQRVGIRDLHITAWYFPISTEPGGEGQTEIIVDAFSTKLGRFIDEDFVDVTSDPTLTENANVNGVVPTIVVETLMARNSVVTGPTTTEPFVQWMLNGHFIPAGDGTLEIAKSTLGIAIAFYAGRSFDDWYYLWETIAPPVERLAYYLGYLRGYPFPYPPYPEFTIALEMMDIAKRVSTELKDSVLELALKQASIATETLKEEIERLKKKPSKK